MGSWSVKVLVSAFLSATFVHAEESCKAVFQDLKGENKAAIEAFNNNSVGKLLNFKMVNDLVLNLNGRYDVKMTSYRGDVLDQKNSGTCHIQATVAEWAGEYKKRHNGEDPNISTEYIIFQYLLRQATKVAMSDDTSLTVPQGGLYNTTARMIKEVGFRSRDQWKSYGGKTDFSTPEMSQVIEGQLRYLMSQWKLQRAGIESVLNVDFTNIKERKSYFQKLFAEGDQGPLLFLRKLVQTKSNELKEGKTTLKKKQVQILEDLSNGLLALNKLSADEIYEIKTNLYKDIRREIESMYATIFFNRTEIPKEVLNVSEAVQQTREMFPEMEQSLLTFSAQTDQKAGTVVFRGRTKPAELNFEAPVEVLVDIVADQIENGDNTVWLGYDHNGLFVDNKSGLMSPNSFQWKPVKPFIVQNERNVLNVADGGHAVQLVGTIREKPTEEQKKKNQPGKLVGFKMQNSWGTEVGQSGIYTMDLDYFKAFIWIITIRDESGQFSRDFHPDVKEGQPVTQISSKHMYTEGNFLIQKTEAKK